MLTVVTFARQKILCERKNRELLSFYEFTNKGIYPQDWAGIKGNAVISVDEFGG
jgi:hypothetical protein